MGKSGWIHRNCTRIEGNARIPGEEELRWAFRGEVERGVGKLGEIQWNGEFYKAPTSHCHAKRYKATIRFDLQGDSQIWIEDEDGSRHPYPRYRVRVLEVHRRLAGSLTGRKHYLDLNSALVDATRSAVAVRELLEVAEAKLRAEGSPILFAPEAAASAKAAGA